MSQSDAQKPARTKRKDLTPAQLERMDSFIEQQPVTGLTDAAIADIIGCHRVTVSRRRAFITARDSEPTPKAAIHRRARERPSPPETAPSARDLLQQYKDIATLSPEEQMKLCSIIAATSPNDNARVAALNALGKFQQMYAPPDRLGPADPLTDDERVSRAAAVLDSIGVALTRRAVAKAFRLSLETDAQEA